MHESARNVADPPHRLPITGLDQCLESQAQGGHVRLMSAPEAVIT